MRCVVTGGAGFIGSNVALALEKEGHEVIILDNFDTGKEENLKEFKGTIMKGDVSEPFKIEGEVDAIFHYGSLTDPRYTDDENMMKVNIDGFKNVVALAHEKDAKLVYASSASVYGNALSPQKEDGPVEIMSAYAKTKIMMDKIAEDLFKAMHIVGLRYFNVFGPHEEFKGRASSMIYHLTKQIKAGKKPKLFKSGEQKRDHLYVKDVVSATILALDAPSGIYNVGTGRGTSFNEIVEYINEALGTNAEIEYIDNPYGETYQMDTRADTTKAKEFLKFETQFTAREGIIDYAPGIE